MSKSDLAIYYRKKYGMKMPTLKLARIMYNEINCYLQPLIAQEQY
jgi:hypothetical protein